MNPKERKPLTMVCLDLEGILVPEIWIAFAEATGIPELKKTTRDEPDYDVLMQFRIDTLRQHGLGIAQIQEVIAGMDPMPGAKAFLDALREETQCVIISDTFEEFARPLMKKLGWPTLLCNRLDIDQAGMICRHVMRLSDSKLNTVRGLQAMGYETIATGDSFNDLGMIRASKAGFLFRTTEAIRTANPDVPAMETYEELLAAIRGALE